MKALIPTRRRFIGIIASASCLTLSPWAMRQALAGSPPNPIIWRGIALGADAELRIYHTDPNFAQALIERSIAEVHRLEQVFSLYQDDSALSKLNRDGVLDHPPADLLRLLSQSRQFSERTGGAFDPSVQSLWRVYADHFSTPNANPAGPDQQLIDQALAQVDYQSIDLDAARIRLTHPGMALTLNGIAQGYITDRIAEMLNQAGLTHALIDMGELRGLNSDLAAPAWQVSLAKPDNPTQGFQTVQLRNQALSTSGGYGTSFDTAGQFTHLFDPKTGLSQPVYRSVSVMADNATAADALSTALSNMPMDQARTVIETYSAKAWLVMPDGSNITLGKYT
ncbi:FAD:protein FMN transferase [Alcaligenaceae bacterium CGII-47]|nr:FAD:protein FMN transferase [Alcaligenaceae bacterium CGII-47]